MDKWSSSLCDLLALAVRDPRGLKDAGWMSHIAPWCEQQPGGLELDGTEVGAAGRGEQVEQTQAAKERESWRQP